MIDWDKDRPSGSTFASDRGWAPGCWPESFVADGRKFRQYTREVRLDNGDTLCYKYINGDGTTVKVYND